MSKPYFRSSPNAGGHRSPDRFAVRLLHPLHSNPREPGHGPWWPLETRGHDHFWQSLLWSVSRQEAGFTNSNRNTYQTSKRFYLFSFPSLILKIESLHISESWNQIMNMTSQGLSSKLSVYPLDTIKKRLQISGWQQGRQGLGTTPSYSGECK